MRCFTGYNNGEHSVNIVSYDNHERKQVFASLNEQVTLIF